MTHATAAPEPERQGEFVVVEDRVSRRVMMYPVFCTANMPEEVFDDFVTTSYHGHYAISEDGNVGSIACILETTELDSIRHGSGPEMKAFESPFLGFTDAQVRQWLKDHPHENFAACTYAIMDEDTIANKTLRVGCVTTNIRGIEDERTLLVDCFGHMVCRVPLEMRTVSWFEEGRVGTDKIYGRKYVEDGCESSSEEEREEN